MLIRMRMGCIGIGIGVRRCVRKVVRWVSRSRVVDRTRYQKDSKQPRITHKTDSKHNS